MRLRPWHINVAFVVALGLLVFFCLAPYFGLKAAPNPFALAAFGVVIGYLFSHKDDFKDGDNGDG
jgi:uncharacterized membrane protein (UPF0136 family)